VAKNGKKVAESGLTRAKEKLEVAGKLFADGFYDDAVSRAYYAVFHAAGAALFLEGYEAKTHAGLINLFGLVMVKGGKVDKKFGKILSDLKNDREDGDYGLISMLDEEDAEKALKDAGQFVAEIERLVRSPRNNNKR